MILLGGKIEFETCCVALFVGAFFFFVLSSCCGGAVVWFVCLIPDRVEIVFDEVKQMGIVRFKAWCVLDCRNNVCSLNCQSFVAMPVFPPPPPIFGRDENGKHIVRYNIPPVCRIEKHV